MRRGWLESISAARGCARRRRRPPGPDADRGAVARRSRRSALRSGNSRAWLLYGVTGSGKTEVYLRLIERVLESGRGALVLVPEIALTPQLVARFRERLAAPIVALHSSLADGARAAAWRAASLGQRAASSSARAPPYSRRCRRSASSSWTRSTTLPTSSRKDSATPAATSRWRARSARACRSCSARRRPRSRSLANVAARPLREGRRCRSARGAQASRASRSSTCASTRRATGSRRRRSPRSSGTSRAEGQVLVFLNRRGYAPTMFCSGCGWIAPCHSCDARLTVHLRRARLAVPSLRRGREPAIRLPALRQRARARRRGHGARRDDAHPAASRGAARAHRPRRDPPARRHGGGARRGQRTAARASCSARRC